MSTITRFVGMDFRSLRTSGRTFVISLALLIVAAVLPARLPFMAIPAMAVFALLFVPQYLFGNDERGRLDTLYGVLGIPRGKVVAGRYLTSLVLLIASVAIGVAIAPLAAAALGKQLDWSFIPLLACLSLAVVGILLMIEIPVYFAVGATRGRMVGLGIPAAIVVLAVLIGMLLPQTAGNISAAIGAIDPAVLALVALAVFVVVTVISFFVSTRVYRKRDL